MARHRASDAHSRRANDGIAETFFVLFPISGGAGAELRHDSCPKPENKKIGEVIRSLTQLDAAEIDKLFLKASTKEVGFAKEHGFVDEIREANLPEGAPVIHLVFKR